MPGQGGAQGLTGQLLPKENIELVASCLGICQVLQICPRCKLEIGGERGREAGRISSRQWNASLSGESQRSMAGSASGGVWLRKRLLYPWWLPNPKPVAL